MLARQKHQTPHMAPKDIYNGRERSTDRGMRPDRDRKGAGTGRLGIDRNRPSVHSGFD